MRHPSRIPNTRRVLAASESFFIGDEVVVGCQPFEIVSTTVQRAGGMKRGDDGAPPV